MYKLSLFQTLTASFMSLILSESQIIKPINISLNSNSTCQSNSNFLVMAGGGNPNKNEIALEKNVLYFQRTLKAMGYNPQNASVFFANGNSGEATVRYIDNNNEQQFKVPEIPYLQGSATLDNFENWMSKTGTKKDNKSLFFYFTGHGIPDALILWDDQPLTVEKFSQELNKLPSNTPVVTMMAQCYSGSFANFIYQDGNPEKPIALQTRCGFFATVEDRPSVGCTPEVNEADYKDYSSSFFAGLSGYNRIGQKVASADYNQDGKVSFNEAHAFAKVDEQTMDWPISTSESWLQKQYSEAQEAEVFDKPIINLINQARPEQQYVVKSLAKISNIDVQKSYFDNIKPLSNSELENMTEVQEAYFIRLAMELINIYVEKQVRMSNNKEAIAILDRLLNCESGFWHKQTTNNKLFFK